MIYNIIYLIEDKLKIKKKIYIFYFMKFGLIVIVYIIYIFL